MSSKPSIGHVSEAPTNPHREASQPRFDVADLYRGPVATDQAACRRPAAGREAPPGLLLDRQPRDHQPVLRHRVRATGRRCRTSSAGRPAPSDLPSGQCYSSFVLLPLLNFAVRRRCLLVGGPGRGKTASAILMGVLAGYSPRGCPPGDPARPAADDHRRPARQSAARRPDRRPEHGRHHHRLAQVAVDARQDHRRVQPHPDPDPVGPADRHGRQLRRDPRPDLRVPRGRLVPDRQRRRRAAAPTRSSRPSATASTSSSRPSTSTPASSATCWTRIEEGVQPRGPRPARDHLQRVEELDRMEDEIRAGPLPGRAAPPARVLRQPVRVLRSRRRPVRVQDQGHREALGRRPGAARRPRTPAGTASRTWAARRATASRSAP